MPSAKPVVIMGAGPAGLTAAWQLIQAGRRDVIIWEADSSYVGGLARTVQAETYRIDPGGHHFFSKSKEINEVWRQIMPDDFVEVPCHARLYYEGNFYDLPIERANVVKKLGMVEGLKVSLSYMKARIRPIKPETSFAHWATNRYGKRLYERFYKFFPEKICGISGDEIDADRVVQEMKPPIQKFFYPRLGPGQMWETAANKILERGGGIFLDRKVQTIHWDETGVTHVTGTNHAGEFYQQEGSHFLSSIPLKELMLSLDPPPPKEVVAAAKALRYRDFLTVCLIVKREEVFPDTWIYIHDPSVKVGRVQNYKNWSAALVPDPSFTSLGMEYFCGANDNLLNATDHDLALLAIREAVQIGLVKQDEVKDAFVVRMPKAYPVYDPDYEEQLKVIKAWVCRFANLQPVGRNGLHRYNNQDHSMMTAMLAVRNIQGASYDCWKVTNEAGYVEGPGPGATKIYKVVFRPKSGPGSHEEYVQARDEVEARQSIQTKHGLPTHLIVSVTEIQG